MSTPILGAAQASSHQMREYLHSRNPEAPDYAQLYLDIGARYGVRGDLAFAQSLHETGFFRFTGTVRPYQNNFSGLGAVTSDTRGAAFATPALGIEAQIQHLYGYATTAPLPPGVEVVDPRFSILQSAGLRGSAPTFELLNGRWAVPGDNYGQNIVRLWQEILQVPNPGPIAQPTPPAPPNVPFPDLASEGWETPFVRAAAELGLLQGYADGTFRPAQNLTRAELAVLLARLEDKFRS